MDTPPPRPLDYNQTAAAPWDAWRLLRLALVLWASIVLIRHASYWGERAIAGNLLGSLMTDPRPILFAAVEAGALIMMLLVVLPATTTPVTLKPVARLAGIFIAANLLSFAFDFFTARDVFSGYGLHLIWLIASRVQLLVVPALAIVAWMRFASPEPAGRP
jgi:hypothetical protein